MDSLRSSLLLLLVASLSAAPLISGSPSDAEDPLIRQVVPGTDGGEDHLLSTEAHFTRFLQSYGKSYSDEAEHAYRFSVFKANLRRARRHQKLDPTAVHGVTQFSDLTPAEFRRTYLGLRGGRRPSLSNPHDAPILPTNDLPADFDWRDHGAVTPSRTRVPVDHAGLSALLGLWKGELSGHW